MKRAIICVSDLHVGSTAGLCPPGGIRLDGGNRHIPNKFQMGIWRFWRHFWGTWVPQVTADAKVQAIVINGDAIEGLHHNITGVVSTSKEDQRAAAEEILEPLKAISKRIFLVRGTEAHGGGMGEDEEELGRSLKTVRNEVGDYTWWQVWLELGKHTFQFAHHIETTSSAAYESSAPMREMITGLVEAAQWGRPMPDVFVRSHRHRFIEIPLPTIAGRIRIVITPAWQLRTPNVEKRDRMRMPHIGGVAFITEDGTCQVRERLYPLPEPKPIHL